MIEAQLNIFDMVVLGVMALSCLIAFFRGFVREILSLGAWVGAGLVTVYFMESVGVKLEPYFRKPEVATGVGAMALFFGSLIAFSFINIIIRKFLKEGSDVGMLDNLLGLIFGVFRGAFIVSLGYFLLSIALPEKEHPKWISESMAHPYVEKGAIILTRLAPEYMRETSTLQKKAVDQARRKMRGGDADYQTDGEEEGTGYSRRNTQQFDRLLESSEPSR